MFLAVVLITERLLNITAPDDKTAKRIFTVYILGDILGHPYTIFIYSYVIIVFRTLIFVSER